MTTAPPPRRPRRVRGALRYSLQALDRSGFGLGQVLVIGLFATTVVGWLTIVFVSLSP